MNIKKKIVLMCSALFVLLTSCTHQLTEPGTPGANPNPSKPAKPVITPGKDLNPTVNALASVSQDFIFNTNSVGFTTITIRRSEWNKMLTYFDYFYKNENNVIAESYEYTKDGKTWYLNNVGLRLRGNTSRFKPQGKDTPDDETGHRQPNADWSSDYYNYAANCSDNDYRQSHFKVDFEPFDDDDRKMSGCMKGVALKRSDDLFSKEIFCYHLFHEYGIWTAPRASQTKVDIHIIEDVQNNSVIEDISNCEVTKVNYGVYEMFEEVNKQSLKGRMSKKGNNKAENAWSSNDGDLWKCSGGDLTSSERGHFGVEDIKINNTTLPKSQWKSQPDENVSFYNPIYDLKTNKSELDRATGYFQKFIDELSELWYSDPNSEAGINARKAFYEKWFDVDFFIKTYAVNCLVGMDDDYWGNANNYYLYFDNGAAGTGKCYFIPFDYDNTLGASIDGDRTFTNPLLWGTKENGQKYFRPLLDRLLEVPEYLEKMKKTLLEISSQDPSSPWNKDKCFALWSKWHAQVAPYVSTPDISGWPNIGSTNISDSGGWKDTKHYLTYDADGNNFYEQVYLNYRMWLSDKKIEIKFNLNGGSFKGDSGVITKEYNGMTSNLNEILGIPERPGYEFIGWTKTQNSTDYIQNFKYDENEEFIAYASWVDLSAFGDELSIFAITDSTYQGIKIGILNLPENNYRRTFYINGKEVGGDSYDEKDNGKYKLYERIWAYPFVEPGKPYTVQVSYSDVSYRELERSNIIEITPESGLGEFKVIRAPEWYVQDNQLKWRKEPVIQIGNGRGPKENDNWDEYFLLELQTTTHKEIIYADDDRHPSNWDSEASTDPIVNTYDNWWNYQSWNWMGASCNKTFNIKEHVNASVLSGEDSNIVLRIKYNYNESPYGDLTLIIEDYNVSKAFNIE